MCPNGIISVIDVIQLHLIVKQENYVKSLTFIFIISMVKVAYCKFKEFDAMLRNIVLGGFVLCAILLMPMPVTFARGGGVIGSPKAKPKIYSTNVPITNGMGTYNGCIDYIVQFQIGQNVSSFEIAPAGSTEWRMLVDANQIPLHVNNGRIVHLRQEIFDNNYTFDVRINGAVVWHNVKLSNERLIIFGYNDGPTIVAITDFYRK